MDNMNLLLVEDNEGDIFLMREVIQMMGITNIFIKKDGKAAMEFLLNTSKIPNLIFLDINLPKVNGFEVLEFIKSNNTLENIPVVIFSTSSSMKDVMLAYKNEASCFLTKQDNFDDFQDTLSKCIKFWIEFSLKLSEA
ncbi:response regulator [Arenibacter sp. BSSL-BM3]|uniref:Response regulator n=1 Tax=Arenibacter arenosicollis TaxID=2762274 RepID=A0ABR7QQ97_9FLAO|nr:response regulator [Arenibacter arenosicollis]MBC8769368.1 response regulator [Arenibacter arenosicollis]